MRDIDDEVREIKKEIIESRTLIIKTNNLINALGADIKSIAKRQENYERRFNWNSWVVYIIIAALCFFGLSLASDARIGAIRTEMSTLETQVEELQSELADEVRRASERASAAANAAKLYELIQAEKRTQVIKDYQSLPKEALSATEAAYFRDVERQFRLDLSIQANQKGLELARTNRQSDAIEQFQKAIELRADGPHIPQVQYNLARALRRIGRPAEALVFAQRVAKQTTDRALQPDGWWMTALCARDLRDLDTAREALKTLIKKYPRSALNRDARPLLRELTREVYQRKKKPANSSAAVGKTERVNPE